MRKELHQGFLLYTWKSFFMKNWKEAEILTLCVSRHVSFYLHGCWWRRLTSGRRQRVLLLTAQVAGGVWALVFLQFWALVHQGGIKQETSLMSSCFGGTQGCGSWTFHVLQNIFLERRNTLPVMTWNKGSQSLCLRKKTCRTMSEPRGTVIQHLCPSASSTLTVLADHHLYKRDILDLHITAV